MTVTSTAAPTANLNIFEQANAYAYEAYGVVNSAVQNVWTTASSAVHTSATVLKKGSADFDLTNSLMKIYTSVIKVAGEVFSRLGHANWVPAPLKALSRVFEGASEFIGARKWIGNLTSIASGEATKTNPIFGWPNLISLASKTSGLVADLISTARWLAKHNVISISNTVGLGTIFGRHMVAGLKDVQDTAALTSLALAIADKARVNAERGEVSVNDGLDYIKLGSKVTSITIPRLVPGFIGNIASASATIVSSAIEVFQWGVKNIPATT